MHWKSLLVGGNVIAETKYFYVVNSNMLPRQHGLSCRNIHSKNRTFHGKVQHFHKGLIIMFIQNFNRIAMDILGSSSIWYFIFSILFGIMEKCDHYIIRTIIIVSMSSLLLIINQMVYF